MCDQTQDEIQDVNQAPPATICQEQDEAEPSPNQHAPAHPSTYDIQKRNSCTSPGTSACYPCIEAPKPMPDLVNTRTAIVMVGLPARGKTYTANKLAAYLKWISISTRVFNVGAYRRQISNTCLHDFFDPDNKEALQIRHKVATKALEDAIEWLNHGDGQVAILDATNTTRERRRMIYDKIVCKSGFKLVFLESICNDPELIERNIKKQKVFSPDYYGKMTPEEAYEDFMLRMSHYEKIYQPIDDERDANCSFIKLYECGKKLLVNNISGHLQSKIVYFVMNNHVKPQSIYLTRHGETLYNLENRIGGDPGLSERGIEYSYKLGEYINSLNINDLRVWTSILTRTIHTAKHIQHTAESWKALNEIESGTMDKMTYDEIAIRYPKEFLLREAHKFRYRYPGGESYEDVIVRLEPVIMQLEQENSVLIIGHQAVLRCILAYYLDKSHDELPYIEVPLHCLFKLEPFSPAGCQVEVIRFDVQAVDTHRPKSVPDSAPAANPSCGNVQKDASKPVTNSSEKLENSPVAAQSCQEQENNQTPP